MKQAQKRAHWAAIIEQQKQSTVSIKQFCQDNAIPYQTFYYWSKRLREHEQAQTVQPVVVEASGHLPGASVVLVFANGIRAELPATLNAAQIKHWVDALQ